MSYKDKAKRREYYQKNKQEINRKRKEYYEKHKEEINRKIRKRNQIPEVKARIRQNGKKWRALHREELTRRYRLYRNKYNIKIKEQVFQHYGNKCVCCGENNLKFLSIDHIDGRGRQHRQKIKDHMDCWLVKNNYPKGFQILCYNCNCGKRVNNGICPHKD